MADTPHSMMSSSTRSASVKPRTPNLAALYADWEGMPMRPNTLEMFTTWPSPAALRCGRNAFVPDTTPPRLMAINQS